VSTVGGAPLAVLKQYVDNQKNVKRHQTRRQGSGISHARASSPGGASVWLRPICVQSSFELFTNQIRPQQNQDFSSTTQSGTNQNKRPSCPGSAQSAPHRYSRPGVL